MHTLFRNTFTLLWDVLTTGHFRANSQKRAQVIIYWGPPRKRTEQPDLFPQDASPPGTKVRWWT